MPMSNKVVNPYCSLGWLLIIAIFRKCAKLKPPWVHLGKQNNTIIFFFTIYCFNKKVDLSSLRGGEGIDRHSTAHDLSTHAIQVSFQLIGSEYSHNQKKAFD